MIKADILVWGSSVVLEFQPVLPSLGKSLARHDLRQVAVADEDIGEHAPIHILAVWDDVDGAFAEEFRKSPLCFEAARFG